MDRLFVADTKRELKLKHKKLFQTFEAGAKRTLLELICVFLKHICNSIHTIELE